MGRPIVTLTPIYDEDEDTILARILDPFALNPDPNVRMNVREGGFLYDLLTPVAVELTRIYARLNEVAAVGIMVAAYGDYLDQKGVELGPLPRKPSAYATLTITVEGIPGVSIDPLTRFTTTSPDFATAPVEFVTQNMTPVVLPAAVSPAVTSTVVIPALARVAGTAGNVSVGSVTQMVSAIPGVVHVVNDTPGVGGAEVETDDDYRQRILDAIAASAGAGTIADYRVWATQINGVEDAIVFPTWDGGGTVKVVLIGPEQSLPTVASIRAAQLYIDPSVQLLAAGEPDDAWTAAPAALVYTAASKAEGSTAVELTALLSTTQTATLLKDISIGQSVDADKFRIWVHVVSGLANISQLRVTFTDTSARTAYVNLPGLVLGQQTITWLRSTMTVTALFAWQSIASVKVALTSTSGGTSVIRFDSLRYLDVDGASGQGKAPIGAQVTVTGARSALVEVAATITPRAGYTITGLLPQIQAAIDDLFLGYDENTKKVYLADVAVAIQSVPGVLTHTALTLCLTGGTPTAADLVLAAEDIPVRDVVTLS